jgi:hypothetical protein
MKFRREARENQGFYSVFATLHVSISKYPLRRTFYKKNFSIDRERGAEGLASQESLPRRAGDPSMPDTAAHWNQPLGRRTRTGFPRSSRPGDRGSASGLGLASRLLRREARVQVTGRALIPTIVENDLFWFRSRIVAKPLA